jgi:hypothetical protein
MIRIPRFFELYICFTRFRSSIALSISNWVSALSVRTGTLLGRISPATIVIALARRNRTLVRKEVKYA